MWTWDQDWDARWRVQLTTFIGHAISHRCRLTDKDSNSEKIIQGRKARRQQQKLRKKPEENSNGSIYKDEGWPQHIRPISTCPISRPVTWSVACNVNDTPHTTFPFKKGCRHEMYNQTGICWVSYQYIPKMEKYWTNLWGPATDAEILPGYSGFNDRLWSKAKSGSGRESLRGADNVSSRTNWSIPTRHRASIIDLLKNFLYLVSSKVCEHKRIEPTINQTCEMICMHYDHLPLSHQHPLWNEIRTHPSVHGPLPTTTHWDVPSIASL